jgi:hypothetical protein
MPPVTDQLLGVRSRPGRLRGVGVSLPPCFLFPAVAIISDQLCRAFPNKGLCDFRQVAERRAKHKMLRSTRLADQLWKVAVQ